MGPENTSRVWVCLCFLRSCMTDHGTWNISREWVSSVFPEKLHDWWWDLKTHPGCESVSMFPEKLHDWSWDLKTECESVSMFPEKLHELIMGPENTSSLWVCLCVSWEVGWLIMGPENTSREWVCLCFLRSWMTDHGTWKHIQDVSLSVCFLRSWMTDHGTWKHIQGVSLSVCFLRSWMTDHGT